MDNTLPKSPAEEYGKYLDERLRIANLKNAERNKAKKVGGDLAKKKAGKIGRAIAKKGIMMILPYIPILLLCFVVFFFLSYTAAAISDPTRFLNIECGRAALGDNAAIVDCMKQTVQENNLNSFENQGLTN